MAPKKRSFIFLFCTTIIVITIAYPEFEQLCTSPCISDFDLAVIQIIKSCSFSNTVVLIYGDETKATNAGNFPIQMIDGKAVITINVSNGKSSKTKGNGSIEPLDELKRVQHSIRISGVVERYIFLLLGSVDIETLNPSTHRTRFEWTYYDRVIFIDQVRRPNEMSRLLRMQIWMNIPHIIGLRKSLKGSFIQVFTVYPFCGSQRKSCVRSLNTWLTKKQRFLHQMANFFPDKFSSFQGATVMAGSAWKEPFLIWGNKKQPYKDGLELRLIKLVQKKMNCIVVYGLSDRIGTFTNGTWTGSLGMIMNGSYALAFGGVAVRPEMVEDFAFTRPHYSDTVTFVSPIVRKDDLRGTLAGPFEATVWYSIGITGIIVCAITLLLANAIDRLGLYRLHNNDRWFMKPENMITFIMIRAAQRPCPRVPQSDVLRWVFGTASLGSYLAGIVFVTYLISTLSNYKARRFVDKVDEIIPSGIRLDVPASDAELYPRLEKEKPELWNHATRVNWFEIGQSLKAVTDGSRIYIDSRAKLEYLRRFEYNGTRIYNFHVSSENVLERLDLTWIMNKNWPFRKAVNDVVVRAVECGIVEYWMSKFRTGLFAWDDEADPIEESLYYYLQDWDTTKKQPQKVRRRSWRQKRTYHYEAIKMTDIASVRELFSYGCVASIACLILELLTNALKNLLQMLTWIIVSILELLYHPRRRAPRARVTHVRSNRFPEHQNDRQSHLYYLP